MQIDTSTIADTEKALTDKGIKPDDYDSLLVLLETRQQAVKNLEQERQNQFYGDGFNLLSAIQKTTQSDSVVVAAKYLRAFAEHIALNIAPIDLDRLTIKEIIDAMPQLGEVSL